MKTNDGLFRLHPLVPLCVCLALGIHAGRASVPYVGGLGCFLAFLVVLAAAFLLWRKPVLQTAALLLASFLLGCALVVEAERGLDVVLPEGDATFECVVAGEPVERGRTVRLDLLVASGPLCGHTVRASLLKDTVERRYRSIGVGDGLVVRSRLRKPENFADSNFDYVAYLKGRGIVATAFVYPDRWSAASVSLSELSSFSRARLAALRWRSSLLLRFRSLGLDGQAFAVVAAMSLGDGSAISAATREVYSVTGASHVLALSGLHLSIVYALLSLFSTGRRFRGVRECLLLFVIWCYVFLVGMPVSVLRSALMITVYSVVGLTGRRRMSVSALAFAAIVLLVANPFALYDIGFQLSFMAVAFIVVFRFVFGIVPYKYQQEHRVVRWVWQTFAMSLLAQLGTAPLVAYYFGRLPVYSLLTNFMAIPAATVILYASAAALVLFAVPVVRHVVAIVLVYMAGGLNSALCFVSSLPHASVDGLRVNTLQVALGYVMIVCSLLLLRVCVRRRMSDAFAC